MAPTYDCSVHAELLTGTRLARSAIGRGELIVIPTDTVYGVAADAFSHQAVSRLLKAKGRGRQSPPPVLIPGIPTLDALAASVPDEVRELVAAFWPGGLTVILPAAPLLTWDLGETRGTVALRMPNHALALEILSETGPLAVSSANLTGEPAAVTAAAAEEMLGESVAVYLDAGTVGLSYSAADSDVGAGGSSAEPSGELHSSATAHPSGALHPLASTIVDATGLMLPEGKLRIVRRGVIPTDAIRAIVGERCE
jgi:tRNA threonylcarbamoyl adenosine modification protein (Sua5/YciO/YrdC/YwlC family)